MTTSMVGLETVTYAKISPKVVNPRDIAGEPRRRRRRRNFYLSVAERSIVEADSSLRCALLVAGM